MVTFNSMIGAPLLQEGSFPIYGKKRYVNLGWRPDRVTAKCSSANAMQRSTVYDWMQRSFPFINLSSLNNGIVIDDNGFWIGETAQDGAVGDTMYWTAIKNNGSGFMQMLSYQGTQIANTVWNTRSPDNYGDHSAKQIRYCEIKRDAARVGVCRAEGQSAAVYMDGTAANQSIAALGVGQFTVDASIQVNEWDGPGGLGEGLMACCFTNASSASPYFNIVHYVGNGGASQSINLGLDLTNGGWTETMRDDGAASTSMRFKNRSMPANECGVASAAANVTTNFTTQPTTTVSVAGTMNTNGVAYTMLVFKSNTASSPIYIPKVKGTQQIVRLSGNASYINCGNSDVNLQFTANTPQTILWRGIIWFSQNQVKYDSTTIPLITRGNPAGSFNSTTAGEVSLYEGLYGSSQSPYYWPTPSHMSGLTNCWNLSNAIPDAGTHDLSYYPLRAGVPGKFGVMVDVVTRADGNGIQEFWRDAVCRHVKNLDLWARSSNTRPNTGGGAAGHYTVIGAARSSGGFAFNAQIDVRRVKIWNRYLSGAEIRGEYFAGLGYGGELTDHVEGWDANNATGTTLPADKNAANNGSIVGGTLLTISR